MEATKLAGYFKNLCDDYRSKLTQVESDHKLLKHQRLVEKQNNTDHLLVERLEFQLTQADEVIT